MSTREVDIRNGKAFPEPFRFYLLTGIICVATITSGEYQGFGFLFVPLLGITARRGTQFTTKGYRRYFSVFGLKFGVEKLLVPELCYYCKSIRLLRRDVGHERRKGVDAVYCRRKA